MRILVLLAIALLIYIIITNLLRQSKREQQASEDSETMVKCDLCGLHVAEREAFKEGDQYFCCHDHLELHHKRK